MKHRWTLAVAARVCGAGLTAAGLAAAGPAFAFHFLPAATMFVGSGPVTVVAPSGLSLSCAARYKLKTNALGTKVRITQALYFGASGCSSIMAMGLPWITLPTSLSSILVQNLALATPLGPCGPGAMPATLASSTVSFNAIVNPGGCQLIGNFLVSPTIALGP